MLLSSWLKEIYSQTTFRARTWKNTNYHRRKFKLQRAISPKSLAVYDELPIVIINYAFSFRPSATPEKRVRSQRALLRPSLTIYKWQSIKTSKGNDFHSTSFRGIKISIHGNLVPSLFLFLGALFLFQRWKNASTLLCSRNGSPRTSNIRRINEIFPRLLALIGLLEDRVPPYNTKNLASKVSPRGKSRVLPPPLTSSTSITSPVPLAINYFQAFMEWANWKISEEVSVR